MTSVVNKNLFLMERLVWYLGGESVVIKLWGDGTLSVVYKWRDCGNIKCGVMESWVWYIGCESVVEKCVG
jgi:hypothetical protein